MSTKYVLFYDHTESNGQQVVWDGDTGNGKPKFYETYQACFEDFVATEMAWGLSSYVVPPQIREVQLSETPGEFIETGKVWPIDVSQLDVPEFGPWDKWAKFWGATEVQASAISHFLDQSVADFNSTGEFSQDQFDQLQKVWDQKDLNTSQIVQEIAKIIGV